MMTVDAKGMACPLPVVEAKKAMAQAAEGETIRVLVDNAIAVQNLTKMAQQKGCALSGGETGDGNYYVEITPGAQTSVEADEPAVCQPLPSGKTVVVLSSDQMGGGSEQLGRALMKAFVFALTQMDAAPDTVLLYNGGAKLSSEVPETIADLKKLEEAGCEILTCGTCLDFYSLTDRLAVGGVTNMYAICELLLQAGKVIRP
ncbi:MAG TPA: sulfurtransferase-like selenium metabolism protein YedF [Candidatus Butyricicoccus stercorigallinarum]|nr:sulfurtransferase-like selenium metabolism protein YedF [Candidatus Butyricicoccus stercorigallinarum]